MTDNADPDGRQGDIDIDRVLRGEHEFVVPSNESGYAFVPDFGFNELNRRGRLYQPVVDIRSDPTDTPEWPGDTRFAVCLTHDVDHVSRRTLTKRVRELRATVRCREYYQPKLFVYLLFKRLLSHGVHAVANPPVGEDPLHCYERWLEIEEAFDATSTFFFAPEETNWPHPTDSTYRYDDRITFDGEECTVADMISHIEARGGEIGLHPSWTTYDDLAELRFQKEQLETVVGHPLESVRQHRLHYDIRTTPGIQAEAGFRFDSSLGFTDNVGFRFGTSYPFGLRSASRQRNGSITEIPLIVQDVGLYRLNGSLGLDRGVALEYLKMLAREVKSVGGVLTLSWHPSYITDGAWVNAYQQALEYLDSLGAWFGSVAEIGHWWGEHNAHIREIDTG